LIFNGFHKSRCISVNLSLPTYQTNPAIVFVNACRKVWLRCGGPYRTPVGVWEIVPISQRNLSGRTEKTLVMWEPIQDPCLGRGRWFPHPVHGSWPGPGPAHNTSSKSGPNAPKSSMNSSTSMQALTKQTQEPTQLSQANVVFGRALHGLDHAAIQRGKQSSAA